MVVDREVEVKGDDEVVREEKLRIGVDLDVRNVISLKTRRKMKHADEQPFHPLRCIK